MEKGHSLLGNKQRQGETKPCYTNTQELIQVEIEGGRSHESGEGNRSWGMAGFVFPDKELGLSSIGSGQSWTLFKWGNNMVLFASWGDPSHPV